VGCTPIESFVHRAAGPLFIDEAQLFGKAFGMFGVREKQRRHGFEEMKLRLDACSPQGPGQDPGSTGHNPEFREINGRRKAGNEIGNIGER